MDSQQNGEAGTVEAIIGLLGVALFFGGVIVHLVLAMAVWQDGKRLDRDGRPTFFVDPFFWALMTLMCGLLVVLVYWLMHHSTLRRDG